MYWEGFHRNPLCVGGSEGTANVLLGLGYETYPRETSLQCIEEVAPPEGKPGKVQ